MDLLGQGIASNSNGNAMHNTDQNSEGVAMLRLEVIGKGIASRSVETLRTAKEWQGVETHTIM